MVTNDNYLQLKLILASWTAEILSLKSCSSIIKNKKMTKPSKQREAVAVGGVWLWH